MHFLIKNPKLTSFWVQNSVLYTEILYFCIYKLLNTYTYIHIHTYVYTIIYICNYVCVYMYVYVYMYMYLTIYKYRNTVFQFEIQFCIKNWDRKHFLLKKWFFIKIALFALFLLIVLLFSNLYPQGVKIN